MKPTYKINTLLSIILKVKRQMDKLQDLIQSKNIDLCQKIRKFRAHRGVIHNLCIFYFLGQIKQKFVDRKAEIDRKRSPSMFVKLINN